MKTHHKRRKRRIFFFWSAGHEFEIWWFDDDVVVDFVDDFVGVEVDAGVHSVEVLYFAFESLGLVVDCHCERALVNLAVVGDDERHHCEFRVFRLVDLCSGYEEVEVGGVDFGLDEFGF